MKRVLITIIKIYQQIPLPCHNYCRFIPTCSNYSIKAIEEYGCIKGLFLAVKRLLKCNPWGPFGFDPVIERKK
jgi:putative membrane protein insertion efficiency factor